MAHRSSRLTMIAVVLTIAVGTSCASVPKEVVELSYRMGEDLEAVRTSYHALVHAHFDNLRRIRLSYVENEWAPQFVRNFVANGRLVDVATGKVVWSEVKGDFVPPTPATAPQEMLLTVHQWAGAAVGQIDKKRTALLKPLDDDEAALTASIEDAFNQLSRGNATITAHLNSLRKVQEVQDQALAALKVKDLRDQINAALIRTSDEAERALDEVRKADGVVKQVIDIRTKAESLLERETQKPVGESKQ